MKISTDKLRFDFAQKLVVEDYLDNLTQKNNYTFTSAHFTKLLDGSIELFLYINNSPDYKFKKFESKDYMIGYFRAMLDSRFDAMFNFSQG